MRPDLTRFIRELRKENCPQRVLDEVRRRTAAETAAPRWWRRAMPVTVAALVLAAGLAAWQWPAGGIARQPATLTAQAADERARIARQTEDALGLMGSVLARAGDRSGQIISDGVVPPLQESFQITKHKLIHSTDL